MNHQREVSWSWLSRRRRARRCHPKIIGCPTDTVKLTPRRREVEARPPLSDTFRATGPSTFLATRFPSRTDTASERDQFRSPSFTAAPVLSVTVGTAPLGEVLSR